MTRRSAPGGRGKSAPGAGAATRVATVPVHANVLRAAWIAAIAALVLWTFGAIAPDELKPQLWGVSAYAFLPGWCVWLALVAAVVALGAVHRADTTSAGAAGATHAAGTGRAAGATRAADTAQTAATTGTRTSAGAPEASTGALARIGIPAVLFVAVTAACWFARIRHPLLGDANSLQKSLTLGEKFHPDSPLASILHHQSWLRFGGFFTGDPLARAFQSVALESAIAGGIFAVVAWMFAGELTRDRGEAADAPTRNRAESRGPRWLVFGALVAQGYAQLYFGYVENYTYQALALTAFVWLALRCVAGRGALLWPGLALLIACGFHLSSTTFVPAFALLAALTWRGRGGAHLRDLAVLAVAAVALHLLLAWLGGGYNFLLHPLAMAKTAGTGELQQGSAALWSYEHVRDFLNCQLLIGPLGILLTSVGVGAGIAAWRRRDVRGAWLFATALLALAVSFSVRDLRLGYPRDWDLFAPYGIASAAFGVWTLGRDSKALRLTLIASLFATIPWIAINTSWDRSFERFKHLPLRSGQREMLIGFWYAERGDRATAHQWLAQAIALDRNNTAAYLTNGYLYMAEGRPGEAAMSFYPATVLRPSWWQYRVRLVDALMQTGEYRGAAEEAKPLLTKMPDRARAQAIAGLALWAARAGGDSAQALLKSAAALDASDAGYAGALTRVAAGDTSARAMLGSPVWRWLVRE